VWRRIKNGINPEKALEIRKIPQGEQVEINGEIHTIYEWSRILNIKYDTVWKRIKKGIPPIEALTKSKRVSKKILFNGESHTVYEWAKLFGLKYNVLYMRLRRGVSFKEAINGR
jgi:hypothetical protein